MTAETVSIDFSLCQGHGRCYEIAPDVFEDDDRGYGSVRSPRVAPEHREAVEAALRACPEHAIQLTAESG
jgi:ferredoxin